MTGIWHAMGKQPIIGGLCYVKLNGLKDSFTILISLSLSPLVISWRISKFNITIIHILYICSVPDVEISNMQLR